MKRKIQICTAMLVGTVLLAGTSGAQAAYEAERPAIVSQAYSFGRPQGNIQGQGAQAVIQQVNAVRARNGLPALRADAAMNRAARQRAAELAKRFSHTRPNGGRGLTILSEMGVSYRTAGENIAAGQTSAQVVMSAWMGSSGHRANILSSRFGRIGVGQVTVNGRNYWVQLFAD